MQSVTPPHDAATPLWDVLVVDDEQVVRDGVSRILEEGGFRVAVAEDAASGLAHPALAVCRLVLCDLVLPDASGMDLVTWFLERRPGLPVVLITGLATDEQKLRAQRAGAGAFLAKPFDDSELLATVRAALDSKNALKEEKRP